MTNNWRYINSGTNDPYYNMACDEAIFDSFTQGLVPPTFRIYMWAPPAVSLGISQKEEEVLDLEYMKKTGIGFVKRMTGGQAILHADEITYSISCSSSSLDLPRDVRQSYKVLTYFLVEFYKMLGLDAAYSGIENRTHAGSPHQMCFAGREKYDILVKGRKIGGSAQRRVKNNIFQHGSIPLSMDIEQMKRCFNAKDNGLTLKTTSLYDSLQKTADKEGLMDILKGSFSRVLGVKLAEGGLTALENEDIERLAKEKYTGMAYA